ncbi:hypothetical protein [Enterovirga sp.]|uniref:hypothetical protein n=1 Tax=Enterovirga sp. TaxID=2026350 RepID=UPI002CD99A9A|nr:hypothetical protein [Enterovirga sp.]HMO31048.1 hypothetical protein [Enterovirga sp.]
MIGTDINLSPPLVAGGSAPLLPVEGPIVQAALRLQEAKSQVDAAFWLVQNNPRLAGSAEEMMSTAIARLYEALAALQSYLEIISCKGQA